MRSAIDRVSSRSPPSLDFEHDAVLGVESVYLVCEHLVALLTEKHGASNLLGLLLPCLNLEPERKEGRSELGQSRVARTAYGTSVETIFRSRKRFNHASDPIGRPGSRRVVLPQRIGLGHGWSFTVGAFSIRRRLSSLKRGGAAEPPHPRTPGMSVAAI
jgi:hypothetical protein